MQERALSLQKSIRLPPTVRRELEVQMTRDGKSVRNGVRDGLGIKLLQMMVDSEAMDDLVALMRHGTRSTRPGQPVIRQSSENADRAESGRSVRGSGVRERACDTPETKRNKFNVFRCQRYGDPRRIQARSWMQSKRVRLGECAIRYAQSPRIEKGAAEEARRIRVKTWSGTTAVCYDETRRSDGRVWRYGPGEFGTEARMVRRWALGRQEQNRLASVLTRRSVLCPWLARFSRWGVRSTLAC
ncbi:hypothetical protein DFH06DRAFT_1124261 [Mycena polygramma]|nr:hypothetical protein DFH06DRAFT_1124261 [Mycena polygramma]